MPHAAPARKWLILNDAEYVQVASEFRASETPSVKKLKAVPSSETWKAIGAVKALLGLRHPDTIAGKLKKGALEWRKSVKIATRFREDPLHLLFYLFTDNERKAFGCEQILALNPSE